MVLVMSVKEDPGEKWDMAVIRDSIWQYQEAPLPALPWPEPSSFRVSVLMMDWIETP